MPSEQLLADVAKFNEEMVQGRQGPFREGRAFTETKGVVAGCWIIQLKGKGRGHRMVTRCPIRTAGGEIEIRQVYQLEDFGESPVVDHHRALGETMAKQKKTRPLQQR